MKISLSITFLLLSSILLGQNFAPAGAYWKYSFTSHSGDQSGMVSLVVEKDTFVQSVKYKKLLWRKKLDYQVPPASDPWQSENVYGYFLIENDSLFFHNSFPFQKNLVYDFAPQITDTLFEGEDINLIFQGNSIEPISGRIQQNWIKYCQSDSMDEISFLNDVGFIDDFLFLNEEDCILGGNNYQFVCYADFTIHYPQYCEELNVGISAFQEESYRFHPNPAQDKIEFSKLPAGLHQVGLFDLLGKQMKLSVSEISQGQSLDISHLIPGIYLLKIGEKWNYQTLRLVKQ